MQPNTCKVVSKILRILDSQKEADSPQKDNNATLNKVRSFNASSPDNYCDSYTIKVDYIATKRKMSMCDSDPELEN